MRNLPTKTTESELKEIFNAAIDSGKIVQVSMTPETYEKENFSISVANAEIFCG